MSQETELDIKLQSDLLENKFPVYNNTVKRVFNNQTYDPFFNSLNQELKSGEGPITTLNMNQPRISNPHPPLSFCTPVPSVWLLGL
jgi:hypothetical protein